MFSVLIPKIKNSQKASDYRPINLFNAVYKLVSKKLANRLKLILPCIISYSQSSCILNRLITDNVTIAYEALHSMRARQKSLQGSMAIKLDISKAYDKVKWEYLERIMRKMGFVEQWIH